MKKYTIDDMQKIAKDRGEECLSNEYINSNTKLRWKCKEGHQFDKDPGHIISSNQWCPKCSKIEQNKRSRKYTIEDVIKIAKERRGKCLSKVYINSHTKLKWQCEKGHKFENALVNVKSRGQWCPYCAGRYKTIKDMQKLAKEREGECLSIKYKGVKTKLRWRCKEGHEWRTTPDTIINKKRWCPQCAIESNAKKLRLTIEEMQDIAKERGGECLSTEYINTNTKLRWRCDKGHEWENKPGHIKRGQWCPYCKGRYKTIEDMQILALKKDGKCLSSKFKDNNTKLIWQCNDGHIWEAVPGSIIQGSWCPHCVGRYVTIKEMQDIAKEKGGECLSKEYKGAFIKLKWQCEVGHEWEATPHSIKNGGQWCPTCSPGVSERMCRYIFEKLFDKKFPKMKPKWLVNPKTGSKLELDGYCKELGIAFEYQGKQHFVLFEKHFHRKRSLEEQKQKDELKRNLCEKNNIILIEIPYIIEKNDFATYIITECKRKEIALLDIPLSIFDYKTYEGVYSPKMLKEYQEIARKKGGVCLSTDYINNRIKLKWRCKDGHEWEASPGHIKGGKWCPYCAGSVKLTIDEMQEIAQDRGGECLSMEYINVSAKLKWRCKEGHEWEAVPGSIKSGTWCPKCASVIRGEKRRLTIEEMQDIAKERGGKCLSTEYNDNRTKLKWRCNEGHEWEATPGSIKGGTWCPTCAIESNAKKLRLTIEEMQDIAKERGGECLSIEYINGNTKLRWRCEKGHEWEAVPNHIKQGKWCPYCIGRYKTIEDMQNIAKERGGECLSSKYIRKKIKLKWQCKEGHEWEATPDTIINGGSWCPFCAGRHQTIKDMQKIANERGGECLSKEYIYAKTKLRWKCKEGHEWEATPDGIKNKGSWCPLCANEKR